MSLELYRKPEIMQILQQLCNLDLRTCSKEPATGPPFLLFEFSSQFNILFTQHPFEHCIYIYAILYKVFSHLWSSLLTL